jgi:cellulose synthase/poly-beta-1,6-N-acetylglucosamine synthase-like glycosyltransferase
VIGRIAAPDGVRQPAWVRWELDTLDRQYDDMVAGRFQPCARQFFTANASVRRDALMRAGLFDPEFRRAEDVELAYRLEAQGMRFVFANDAVVVHDTPRSLRAWMSVAEQYGEYDVLMWHRGVRYMLEMTAEDLAYARRLPLRLLARVLVGRRLPMSVLRRLGAIGIKSADRLSRATAARATCSVVFNLLYWDAFARAVGGRARFWELMTSELRPPWPAPAVE